VTTLLSACFSKGILMSRTRLLLMLGAAIPLAACGADEISSPGTGGNIIINNPAPSPTPTPTPTPTPPATVTPAGGCPTIADAQGLTDSGTITGQTGTYRVCTLPARINTSVTLPKIAGLVYRLGGRVDVGTDLGPTPGANEARVTLTIDPGVIVFGGTGVSWLNVNRGHRISAVGTATQPIVFTSRDNIQGLNTENSSGQWGGVVLSGRAQITDCIAPGATPGTIACERQTEGAQDPALYGGATNTDNSGTMSFVQIRYSGFVLSGNSELQSLTTQGTGRGTQLSRIMSFNSSDDGAEFFGGRVNLKYFVSIGAEDDNLDTDVGIKGNFQYVLAVQRSTVGDSIIEADSDNANDAQTPRQNVFVSNMTAIHRISTSNNAAILLRGGTDYRIFNSVLVAPNSTCLRISRANTVQAADPAQDELGPPQFRSVMFQCNATPFTGANTVTNDQVAAIFGSGTNNNSSTYTPTLTGLFVNGATETAVPAFNATALNADPETPNTVFFDNVTYIGAFRDANDRWYQGWVCNSGTADFGAANTNGACTSIPTN
jgi:hypothetical protein